MRGESSIPHGSTRKGTLLFRVPFDVVTSTNPLVAPTGTVALRKVPESTAKAAGVPLNVTPVVPLKPWPKIPNS